MDEARVSFSMAVQQKEELSVCFDVEPLSPTSDLSALLLTKHDFPRNSTLLGRTTLCNEVPVKTYPFVR
jgi:hypothetical protein